jgi:capsular polysaccharide transport system permease protein
MKQVLAFFSPGRLKLVLVLLPMALAAIYFFAIAADRYVSETIVTVRAASQDQSAIPGMALMLGGVNPPSREDTLYLRQYIHSLDLLKMLEDRLQLRAHYESEQVDQAYRLPHGVSQEDFLAYYRNRVEIRFEDMSSLLTVRVQAFEPAFAHGLATAILEECERFVNAFSQRMAREQMAFAETELGRAASKVEAERNKVLAFQTQYKLLDPMAQAQAAESLTSGLQATLAQQEAELRHALTYLNPNSYQIRSQRSQLNATRAQLEAERLRATSGQPASRLNTLAAEFQELTLRASFAQDAYRLALTAVENARIDASRKMKSLVVIDSPSLPETAEYPRRVYNLATLLLVTLLLYGIARLVMATIRDHIE